MKTHILKEYYKKNKKCFHEFEKLKKDIIIVYVYSTYYKVLYKDKKQKTSKNNHMQTNTSSEAIFIFKKKKDNYAFIKITAD